MISTEVRRLGDQFSIGPIGVRDQSIARISAPISPPPARKLIGAGTDPRGPEGPLSPGSGTESRSSAKVMQAPPSDGAMLERQGRERDPGRRSAPKVANAENGKRLQPVRSRGPGASGRAGRDR